MATANRLLRLDNPRVLDAALLVGAFAVVHLIYFLLGVRFDATPFPGFMQFIDRPLLEDRLLESIWYFHAHPPLFNFFVGWAVKLAGEHGNVFFWLGFHLMGLAMICCVFAVTRWLTANRIAAFAAASIVLINPAFVLYENWLMYTFPAAALLTLSCYALMRSLDDHKWLFAFFALLGILALTRSVFHLVWLAAAAGFVWLVMRGQRKRVLIAASLPLLAVAGWYGKNLYYFGSFAASTTAGLGLSNVSTLTFDRDELRPLVENGTLTPFALVSRYTDTEILFAAQSLEPWNVPVVDEVRKSTGDWNFNSRRMIAINDFYMADALTLIRRHPANYIGALAVSNRLYFSPTSMNEYFSPTNRAAVQPVESVFNYLILGARSKPRYLIQPHFGYDQPPSLEVNTGVLLIPLWIVLLSFAYTRARGAVLASDARRRDVGVVYGFLLFNIGYVYLAGTMLELGENYRYRFLTEPLFLILLVAGASAALERLLAGRRRSVTPSAQAP